MPTMAADEYMRTRRTRVGIWLVVAMASLETANGRENTVLLVLVEDSLAKTREKLHGPR
jgi:hypothetical protein